MSLLPLPLLRALFTKYVDIVALRKDRVDLEQFHFDEHLSAGNIVVLGTADRRRALVRSKTASADRIDSCIQRYARDDEWHNPLRVKELDHLRRCGIVKLDAIPIDAAAKDRRFRKNYTLSRKERFTVFLCKSDTSVAVIASAVFPLDELRYVCDLYGLAVAQSK